MNRLRLFALLILVIFAPSFAWAETDSRQDFYVYVTEGTDSVALWEQYAGQVEVIKDFDALELSIVKAQEELLKLLAERGAIEFYLLAKSDKSERHKIKMFLQIENDGTNLPTGYDEDWYYKRINGDAFSQAGIDGGGVVVVVLDTGFGNPNHVWVAGKLERWYDWVNYLPGPYDDMLDFGLSHGMACAGEITRSLPGVAVHLHKIHRAPWGENYIEDILEAYNQILIDKRTDTRPYVVNQSYGLESVPEFQGLSSEAADRIFLEAEERLWKSSPDIYLVAAAGNDSALTGEDGRPPKYPARSNRVIAAGSINWNNEVSFFSTLGGDVWAPGEMVDLAIVDIDDQGNLINDATMFFDGTSFAAPLVVADVAAIISYCLANNITFTRENVYGWVKDWTHKETSVVQYRDSRGYKQRITVELKIIDFKLTVEKLKELIPQTQELTPI